MLCPQFFVNLNDKKKEGTEVDTKKASETGVEPAGGDAAAVDSNTQLQVQFPLVCRMHGPIHTRLRFDEISIDCTRQP